MAKRLALVALHLAAIAGGIVAGMAIYSALS
jgi:hypothetical protein